LGEERSVFYCLNSGSWRQGSAQEEKGGTLSKQEESTIAPRARGEKEQKLSAFGKRGEKENSFAVERKECDQRRIS